jgi:hypothetical protein
MQCGVFVPLLFLLNELRFPLLPSTSRLKYTRYALRVGHRIYAGQTDGNGTGSKEFSVTNDLRNAVIQKRKMIMR